MKPKATSSTIRRTLTLPRPLLEEVMAAAAPEARRNLNRLVVTALREYVAARKARAFEPAMAQMAADPAIRRECAAIAREFAPCMAEQPESLIAAKFRQGWPIDRAIERAVQEALLMHKRLGHSIATWRDGKVVWIPPEEIPEPPAEK